LSECKKLKFLDLSGTKVKDVTPIKDLGLITPFDNKFVFVKKNILYID